MTPSEFIEQGKKLFANYLGKDYADDFEDYICMVLNYDSVETTCLLNMMDELGHAITDNLIEHWDDEYSACLHSSFATFSSLKSCEEMMKIIRENSSSMDNDGK